MPEIGVRNFPLQSGLALPELKVAYETWGRPNEDRTNAILVLHGTTSTHVAAGTETDDLRQGWWDGAIGPGEVFDTDRYWVISANMLGSSYGTTGPASLNPETGVPWGADFPRITTLDIVRAQKALTDALGIERLHVIAGQSVGGLLAFEWAVSFPRSMRALIAHDCGPVARFGMKDTLPGLIARLEAHPNWNGGRYAEAGGLVDLMTEIRAETLHAYGFEEKFRGQMAPMRIDELLRKTARAWAEEFDPMSLVRLNEAFGDFDVTERLDQIEAPLFYVLCDTDEYYPSEIGDDIVAQLRAAGVDVIYHPVRSDLGHYATSAEPGLWVPQTKAFLDAL